MVLIFLLKELSFFLNEGQAYALVKLFETVASRSDQINAFRSFSNPILVCLLFLELTDAIKQKAHHRKEYKVCVTAFEEKFFKLVENCKDFILLRQNMCDKYDYEERSCLDIIANISDTNICCRILSMPSVQKMVLQNLQGG